MEKKSVDNAALTMIKKASKDGVELIWDRLEAQQPQCGFGQLGLCCRNCNHGPCRIDPFGDGASKGVCGATAETIVARNLLRAIAAGAAAHSDHGRDMVFTLRSSAKGEAADYPIKNETKLKAVAAEFGIEINGRSIHDIALELAEAMLDEFGVKKGSLQFINRVPEKRRALWDKLGIRPRGIDWEIVESMHRTHIGVDNDHVSLILQGLRTSLSDGWGGSMIATEVSDILFGTPGVIEGTCNLGVLKEDEVNIICHGHEPTLSEMIVAAARDSSLQEEANKLGAKGINVCGMCCTGNEILMRHGVPLAGNFLHQELAIVTGAVEAVVVDVQCIMPSLPEVAKCYHTRIISTSPKAKFPGAEHIAFDEHNALDIAKQIARKAVENYPNRRMESVNIPNEKMKYLAGFSTETILNALGGTLDPLVDAIKSGAIKGVAGVVGCNNAKYQQDYSHLTFVRRLIKNDILVLANGCNAIACAKAGLLLPEAAKEAGDGLRSVCESLKIPPVLHTGSCVDISRILTIAAAVADTLDVDISELPLVGAAPEWMSEKAISIGTYVVSSGIFTILGTVPQVLGSKKVTELLTKGAEAVIGATFAVEEDPVAAADLAIKHIERKREALGL
ncbi:MAG: carbon-monoxide dehydrogenase catalytic subunit [Deltaproteobacteria bacterium]|nr:MAG: carbon-monoxide dehydrogenase catalytic subunit [Deltaproteobacteria bacterium]